MAPGDEATAVPERLAPLLREYRAVQRRHGPPDEGELIDKVLASVAVKRTRLEYLQKRIAELRVEAGWLEDEIAGRVQSLELLVTDVLRRFGRIVEEAWSPAPVLGFRMWTMESDGLRGARVTWTTPTMTAECLPTGDVEDVPHSDGRCGRLGCGVYATKELHPLLTTHLRPQSHGYVVGLVALTGRVVEHERGYRAAHAEIVALVAVEFDRYLETDDPVQIAGLCAQPVESIVGLGRPKPADPLTALETYLNDLRGRSDPWTSASRSE